MDTINLSEIKNMQNMCVSKSELAMRTSRLLMLIKDRKRGKFPTCFYKGKQIKIDVKKEDIEEIIYCENCGYQEVDSNIYNEGDICPSCGRIHSWGYQSYRLKGT